MRKKSKYIRKSDVLMVWKCPDCGKYFRVLTSWTEENGTPMCCDCDVNCNFSHVLVKRPPRRRLVVTQQGGLAVARIAKGKWGNGSGPNAAIGDLVRSFPEEFCVKIV